MSKQEKLEHGVGNTYVLVNLEVLLNFKICRHITIDKEKSIKF